MITRNKIHSPLTYIDKSSCSSIVKSYLGLYNIFFIFYIKLICNIMFNNIIHNIKSYTPYRMNSVTSEELTMNNTMHKSKMQWVFKEIEKLRDNQPDRCFSCNKRIGVYVYCPRNADEYKFCSEACLDKEIMHFPAWWHTNEAYEYMCELMNMRDE